MAPSASGISSGAGGKPVNPVGQEQEAVGFRFGGGTFHGRSSHRWQAQVSKNSSWCGWMVGIKPPRRSQLRRSSACSRTSSGSSDSSASRINWKQAVGSIVRLSWAKGVNRVHPSPPRYDQGGKRGQELEFLAGGFKLHGRGSAVLTSQSQKSSGKPFHPSGRIQEKVGACQVNPSARRPRKTSSLGRVEKRMAHCRKLIMTFMGVNSLGDKAARRVSVSRSTNRNPPATTFFGPHCLKSSERQTGAWERKCALRWTRPGFALPPKAEQSRIPAPASEEAQEAAFAQRRIAAGPREAGGTPSHSPSSFPKRL